jgi:hypothetical protein
MWEGIGNPNDFWSLQKFRLINHHSTEKLWHLKQVSGENFSNSRLFPGKFPALYVLR